jgi:hypothetical protein
MSSIISVRQLCNRSTNLHLCGYSEEVLDDLIQDGDLQGNYSAKLGELVVDKNSLMDFCLQKRKVGLMKRMMTKGRKST